MVDSRSKTPRIGGGDRLSGLPDSAQLHILSFLPIDQAIRTSILSRQWRRTWTALPDLHFDLAHLGPNGPDFIDQALARRDGSSTLRRFSVTSPDTGTHRVSTWVRYAAAHGVQSLAIKFRKFKLKPLPDSVRFEKLRTLDLYNPVAPIGRLISSCPAIENLFLSGAFDALSISSPTLRTLHLVLMRADSVSVACPRLERFEMVSVSDLAAFHGDMPCLEVAKVYCPRSCPCPDQVLASLGNAGGLTIFSLKFELCADRRPPSFSNLKYLTLIVCFHDEDMERLVQLLEHAPNLSFLKLYHKQTCFCDEKRESWKARKLPFKILCHLQEMLMWMEQERNICNMDEFMKYLFLNWMPKERVYHRCVNHILTILAPALS